MDIQKYVDQLRAWVEPYLISTEPVLSTKRCCLHFSQDSMSILCLDTAVDENNIIYHDKLKYTNKNDLPLVLDGIVKEYDLEDAVTYWLLSPSDYQLNLIESIPVPKDEFRNALTWRIRSLINYPVDEAAIDYFELPAKKNTPSSPLIATVTSQKTQLSEMVNVLHKTNLNLAVIDIPELALLQLVKPYETDEKSTAFIYIGSSKIILNISCKQTLYFTRHLDLPFAGGGSLDLEKIALDVMRYFDFFRSQWRYPAPRRIFLGGNRDDMAAISESLGKSFSNPVVSYTQPETDTPKVAQDIYDKYLLEYGCLLQKGTGNASTRN